MQTAVNDLDFPMPKYRRGQKVWFGSMDSRQVQLPCPDCLGTKRWKVVTPAGSELEAVCVRCSGYWSQRGVPSLQTYEHVLTVREMTIGSVEIKSVISWEGDSKIKYMCVETGVGSGPVYDENDLHETEEAARLVAQFKVNGANAKIAATPERIEKHTFELLQLESAAFTAANDAVWNSWYRYRTLREDVEGAIEDKTLSASELKESLREHLDWDKNHRPDRNPFDAILVAAKSAAERYGDQALADAISKLPSMEARAAAIAAEMAS